MMSTNMVWLAVSGGICVIAGCGGAPAPTQSQTEAVAQVRAAEAIGATSTPEASYQLELARGELQQADTLVRQGRMAEAREVFDRAKADADLAIALRHEAEARTSASQSHEHIEELREGELGTSGGASTAIGAPTTAPTHTTTTTTTTIDPGQ